jgi:hypothetical protein
MKCKGVYAWFISLPSLGGQPAWTRGIRDAKGRGLLVDGWMYAIDTVVESTHFFSGYYRIEKGV